MPKKDAQGNVHIGPDDVKSIAKVNKLKPDVRKEMKSVKGYRETEKLDASGRGTGRYDYNVPGGAQAFGEMMAPYWKADLARHQQNRASMGEQVCEGRAPLKATRRYMRSKWYRRVNGVWLPEKSAQ